MGNKRCIDQTYFKINNTNNTKVALLESFLDDNKYDYEQCDNAVTLYAKEFYDDWKDEIESGVCCAMKRMPEDINIDDDFIISKCLDGILDNEKYTCESIVDYIVDEYGDSDIKLNATAEFCAYSIDETMKACGLKTDDFEVIIDKIKAEFTERMNSSRRHKIGM